MTEPFADLARIAGYHAHVYYEPTTRPQAERLRQAMGGRFAVTLGRWHDQPVGPHPQSMYQVAFAAAEFARLVPWLMLNRAGLSILVHPSTATTTRIMRDSRSGSARRCRCVSRCCATARTRTDRGANLSQV